MELGSNDGVAQLISSLCEARAHNTVSVFPPRMAQAEPRLPGSASGLSPNKAQAGGVCKVQRLTQG